MPIPGNDDAIRSIQLVTRKIADACIEGVKKRREVRSGGVDVGAAYSGAAPGPQVEVTRRPRTGVGRSKTKAPIKAEPKKVVPKTEPKKTKAQAKPKKVEVKAEPKKTEAKAKPKAEPKKVVPKTEPKAENTENTKTQEETK
jgi:ribosomal protein S2